jgi:hypothetical protein
MKGACQRSQLLGWSEARAEHNPRLIADTTLAREGGRQGLQISLVKFNLVDNQTRDKCLAE